MKPGVIVAVPELPGRWQVWDRAYDEPATRRSSKAAESDGPELVGLFEDDIERAEKPRTSPGLVTVVPAGAAARATGVKYAVIRITDKATGRVVELVRTDPAFETLRITQDAS